MNAKAELFLSRELFQQAFIAGLERQLENDGTGIFVLVLANASFDPLIWHRLKPLLQNKFQQIAQRYRQALINGMPINDAPDDVDVFLRLMAVGFDAIQTTEFRQEKDWLLQFNQLRSFRPARMSNEQVDVMQKPFDPNGFHFNKPFLQKEILWQGDWAGRSLRLLYNKFPFAKLHGLLVIDAESSKPQFLLKEDHLYVMALTRQLGQNIPGFSCAYNSYGAYSSVNHQHFQTFVAESALPVQDEKWQHNGGSEAYPVSVTRFDDAVEAYQFIQQLHEQTVAYNLLYVAGEVFVASRNKQGHYQHSDWTSGFAWSEVFGGITCFNQQLFESLNADEIEREFALLGFLELDSL